MSKGGGSSAPSSQTVTQHSLPEYAEPYYRDLLSRAAYESAIPYQPYGGQRLAYFSPMEQAAMSGYGRLGVSGTPEELNMAGSMAAMAGQGFNPGIGVNATSTYNPGAAPFFSYNPTSRSSGYSAGSREPGYQAGILGPAGYYTAGRRDVGFEPGSLADSVALEAYMNPYTQQVVDIQKREAMRDADIRHRDTGLDMARQGGLGGYRDAIMRSETERQLGQRLDDIQLTGQERAFTSAQQAFEADRQARAQLEMFQQQQFQMNEAMKQRVAELVQSGYSMTEANRQAQEEFEQSQFGLNEGARQAQEQFAQSQFGLNAANAQFGAGLQLQAYQAAEQAKQAAARMGLDAAQINQAGQIAAAQIMLGQQQNQISASQLLGGFAGQRQAMEMDRLNAMMGAGAMERGLLQQSMDMAYQDYLRQQAYPRESLAFYSSMLQGLPVQPGSMVTQYGNQPGYGQQLLGAGLGALGMYNAFGGNG